MKQIKLSKEKAKANFMNFLTNQIPSQVLVETPIVKYLRVSEDCLFSELTNELLEEYHDLYEQFTDEQKERLRTVQIKWMRRKAYKQTGVYYKQRNTIYLSKWFKEMADLNDPIVKDVIKGLINHELGHIKWFDHYGEFRAFEKACRYTKTLSQYNKKTSAKIVAWVKGEKVKWGKYYIQNEKVWWDYTVIETGNTGRFSFPTEHFQHIEEFMNNY